MMDNCYGKGDKLPKELMNTQDERLTNKHIQTLTFLKEMASENKELKQRIEELEHDKEKCKELHALAEDSQSRIKDIQEKYLQRADEINQMLSEQHRTEMMEVLDEKMETERRLKEEILKLRHEVESLQRTNVELRDDTDWSEEKEKLESRVTELELLEEGLRIQAEELTGEVGALKKEVEKSEARSQTHLHQLEEERAAHVRLTEQLQEARQSNKEQACRLDALQREAGAGQQQGGDLGKMVETLRNTLEKLLKEKELAVLGEADLRARCQELTEERDTARTQLNRVDGERARLLGERDHLAAQCAHLRQLLQKQEQDKATFRDFVALKRELVTLRNENEILRLKVKTSSGPLPTLKEDLPPPPVPKAMTRKGKKKLLAITLSHGTGPVLQ